MKSLSIYLLPLIGFLFYSCIDAPVNQGGNMISGSVYDRFGGLSYGDYYYISPGNFPITASNGRGFNLKSFNKPYDLVISEYFKDLTLKYEGITSDQVKLVYSFLDFRNNNNSPDWPSFNIGIKFPEARYGSVAFIKFISDSLFFQERVRYDLTNGDTLKYITIYVPSFTHYPSLKGKIIFIKTDIWYTQNIDFNKFGIKNSDSVNYYGAVEFNEQEISYDPKEILTSFQNNIPAGTYSPGNNAALNFPGYDHNSDLVLYEHLHDNVEISIPVIPIENLMIKYTGTYRGGSYFNNGFKQITLTPGENAVITHKEPVKLFSPLDRDSNINGTTIFSITDDNQPGVYLYEFYSIENLRISKQLKYYTTRKELAFSDITCRGFEFKPNCLYYWWVSKFPEYNNVNELLSVHYMLDPRYNSVQMSEQRRFYTGP